MGGIKPGAPSRCLARLLREHIELGLYLPGERLPSLTALADQHGVKHGVVRNALALLCEEGLVVCRNGDGHYVMLQAGDGTTPEVKWLSTVRSAVFHSGLSIPEIARRAGVSRWVISRRISGELTLTDDLAQKILNAINSPEQSSP